MGLECLIVTCDPSLLGHVQASMGTHGASFQFRQDRASAIELASRRHLDGAVIDCDVLEGAGTIPALRGVAANRQTLVLAVVNGFISAEEALSLGADFVIRKPIERSRLREILDVAVPKMEREHRRYFRYDVDLPVRFQTSPGQSFAARMKNVSENGLAVKLVAPLRLKGVVTVEFELPSVSAQIFHAKADVVWNDSFAMGLRFLHIDRDSGVALHQWLRSLEGRDCFRESGGRNGS